MGKTKAPSLNKDESTATGKRVAELDNPEKSRHDTSADLKEDKLAAFQNIIGEIDRQAEYPQSDSPDDSDTGETDEQELGQEKPAALDQAIETIAREKPIDLTDSDDDSLDEDQQKAFESIMAQLEGDGPTDAGSQKETGEVSESEPPDRRSAGQEKGEKDADAGDDAGPEDAQGVELKDDESQPGSYDIEDILTAITLSDDDSSLPDDASDDSGSQKATVEASKETMVDDDIVADQKADSGLEPIAPHQTETPAGQNEETAEPDERLRAKDGSVDPQSSVKPVPARLKDRQNPEILRQASTPANGRQKKGALASVLAILVAAMVLALGGYFYGIFPNRFASTPATPDTDTAGRSSVVIVASAPQLQKPVAVAHSPSDQSRLDTAAEELDRLRRRIIEKHAEIGELRAYYQAGIDAEIQNLADTVKNAGKGKITLKSAMADPSISMGLSAIQRRETYIKKLETPQQILVRSSEALLYFSRRAALLALMAGKTSDIDIDGFIAQADEVRKMHGGELAQLNIDAVPASPRTLASIWQDVETRAPVAAVTSDVLKRVTHTDNPTIWKDICKGDFSQKHRLTKLSLEAAGCLTAWKGKDLFLNALIDLSPEAARHLSAWEGDWLGLNGLTELSPEAAVHLSRWKGKGLSLNGLSSLSPRLVAILSNWQGDQIELINLKHMAPWGNPNTRLFLSEELTRKREATGK